MACMHTLPLPLIEYTGELFLTKYMYFISVTNKVHIFVLG